MTASTATAAATAARPAPAARPARAARAARARRAVTAAAAAAAAAGAAMLALAAAAPPASAAVQLGCAAVPSACCYPDATNSGVPAGTTLLAVPGQVSSGPGWHYVTSGYVAVTGAGAVLSGLYIPYNVDITASNVTIRNSKIVTAGSFAVSLRHTTGVTITHSAISGASATTGRAGVDISDIYGDSTGMTITGDNISNFKTAIQVTTGIISGNYIHDPGYVAGDHTNGIFDTGTTQALSITGNTILNSFGQTDAISLDDSAPNSPIANKTVTGNLLGGGSYTIYGGNSLGNTSTNMHIDNNRFSQAYYARSGQYGPVAYYTTGPASTWTGNFYDTTGASIPW